MKILYDNVQLALTPTAIAIGVFDGLHVGHQELVRRLVAIAHERGCAATIVTFDPHPASVLAPSHAPRLLSTLAQRLEGFGALGVDQVRIIGFTPELAVETAEEFVDRVLVGELDCKVVLAGDDTHFGRDRMGNTDLLIALSHEYGFAVESCESFGDDGRYSSSRVRNALEQGDCDAAARILGRPFVMRGTVVHGDHRGREIGYPTANLLLADSQVLPELGIYAGAAQVAGTWRAAAISVGKRPHFYDDGAVLVEVHLPDFTGDLYGMVLDVAFLHRLRGEAAFETLEDLLSQMSRDVASTVAIFLEFTPEGVILLG